VKSYKEYGAGFKQLKELIFPSYHRSSVVKPDEEFQQFHTKTLQHCPTAQSQTAVNTIDSSERKILKKIFGLTEAKGV
jgi:hypothetical protein